MESAGAWQIEARNLAETAMFRYKTIFGGQLSTRLIETQTTQAMIRCAALNTMTHLCMPQSYKIVRPIAFSGSTVLFDTYQPIHAPMRI